MTTDQHLNTGAMALGALPDDEAVDYTDHLESCPTCSAELTSFLETAAILGSSVAQTPPASLRRSVMEAVGRTPQLPPLTDVTTGVGNTLGRHRQPADAQAAPVVAAAAAHTGIPDDGADVAGTPGVVRSDSVTNDTLATVTPMGRWYRRPQALLAAAVAILVIAGGATFALTNRSTTPSVADPVACVAAASDKSVVAPTVGASAGGDITLAPSCDTALVNVPKLPAPPSGKVYQLWVIKGANASSVSVMKANADGTFSAVPANVHAGDTAVGVTLEPAPGSTKPTSAPFWVVPLTA